MLQEKKQKKKPRKFLPIKYFIMRDRVFKFSDFFKRTTGKKSVVFFSSGMIYQTFTAE